MRRPEQGSEFDRVEERIHEVVGASRELLSHVVARIDQLVEDARTDSAAIARDAESLVSGLLAGVRRAFRDGDGR